MWIAPCLLFVFANAYRQLSLKEAKDEQLQRDERKKLSVSVFSLILVVIRFYSTFFSLQLASPSTQFYDKYTHHRRSSGFYLLVLLGGARTTSEGFSTPYFLSRVDH